MNRAGYVLVGGRSSRMGRDKALLPFRGTPLAVCVAREVALAAGSAVLVGDPALYGHLGFSTIADLYPGEGPLGGILTALHHSPAEWNVVVACDMPGLSADFLRGLFAAAESRDAAVLIPAGPSARVEPLCAVYHRRVREALDEAFAAGTRKVAAALFPIRGGAILPVPELTPFQNVNTPADWAGYASE